MNTPVHNISDPLVGFKNALAQHPLLLVGDAHWYGNVFEQITDWLLDDDLLTMCQTFILEMGARQHEPWLNDYVSLTENENSVQLQRVLLDSLIFPAWFAPHYLDFFKRVRKKNQQRNEQGQPLIQLKLAEPEFDWREIQNPDDYRKIFKKREKEFTKVSQEVIDANEKAIVLCGAWHILKAEINGKASFASHLYQQDSEYVYSVWPHMNADNDEAMSILTAPSLIGCDNKLISHWSFSDMLSASGKPPRLNAMTQATLPKIKQVIDAYLYLGPQRRRTDYDFSIWKDVNTIQLTERARFMNERQQEVVRMVLDTLD